MAPCQLLAVAAALFCSITTVSCLHAVAARSPAPAPISLQPFNWEGNDGPWSAFLFQVGSPFQSINLLVSNTQPVPWVIDAETGCIGMPTTCPDDRGQPWNQSNSNSWKKDTTYGLIPYDKSQEGWLGYAANGTVGTDSVAFDWHPSAQSTINGQTIIVTNGGTYPPEFSVGFVGIFPRPVNLSQVSNSSPSLLQSLHTQKRIPSLSWGYTAGSYNQQAKTGSLVLGGYDRTRLDPFNRLSLKFGSDQSRDLTVYIKSIDASTVSNSSASKSFYAAGTDRGLAAMIDFTLPYLYLPQSVCESFEAAFGLNRTDGTPANGPVYFLTDDQHKGLVKLNANVTFTLGSDSSSDTVRITMPYVHFDLVAKFPFVDAGTQKYYFPLKPVPDNDSAQIVLGRAFMQSAYVFADYSDDRQNFTVAQANFTDTNTHADIVAIIPPNGTGSGTGLSTGAIIGIAIGSLAVVAIVGLIVWMRRRRERTQESVQTSDESDPFKDKPELEATEIDPTRGKCEADGVHSAVNEMPGHIFSHELGEMKVSKVHEMPHEQEIYEMPAEDVALPELESNAAETTLNAFPEREARGEPEEHKSSRARFSYED